MSTGIEDLLFFANPAAACGWTPHLNLVFEGLPSA